jgi:decaprenyl-phosphate phosphoribosyltransferase
MTADSRTAPGDPSAVADQVPATAVADAAVLPPGDMAAGRPRRSTLALAVAAVEAARPRQWPKNLLVFAAPLAGASLGRAGGFVYALVAAAAFTAASAAVYLVNDVVDADRDRRHPSKKRRPVASGRLPVPWALASAGLGVALALTLAVRIDSPALAAILGGYVAVSALYTVWLKHLPWFEVGFVAVGFVLRALGGAAATHVPPSVWFLTVCSLGALMVAVGKRYSELSVLGDQAVRHRPVMRWYSMTGLRAGQRAVTGAMLAAYLLWALSEQDAWMQGWHLASALPLLVALARFDRLTGMAEDRPVEDLIARDSIMVCSEAIWLTLFLVGL